jgi:hypothetical protein
MQLSETTQFRLQRRWLLTAFRWGAAGSVRGSVRGLVRVVPPGDGEGPPRGNRGAAMARPPSGVQRGPLSETWGHSGRRGRRRRVRRGVGGSPNCAARGAALKT